jgi:hypothetical protein
VRRGVYGFCVKRRRTVTPNGISASPWPATCFEEKGRVTLGRRLDSTKTANSETVKNTWTMNGEGSKFDADSQARRGPGGVPGGGGASAFLEKSGRDMLAVSISARDPGGL